MAASGTIAVLMEGRAQKGFISLAELSDRETSAIRGFTTLSVSLGRMVLALHEGLLHAIENEEKLSVLPHLFRTLNCLIAATPYDRMPSDLRTRIVRSMNRQWMLFHGQADSSDISREVACMIALRTVFGAAPPDANLLQHLDEKSQSLHDQSALGESVRQFLGGIAPGWSLFDALLAVAYIHKAVVRSEALAALSCVATNYGGLYRGLYAVFESIYDWSASREMARGFFAAREEYPAM